MKNKLLLVVFATFSISIINAQMFDFKNGIGFRKTFIDYNTLNNRHFDAFREYSDGVELIYQRNFSKTFALAIPIGMRTSTDSAVDHAIDPTFSFGAQAQYHFYKGTRWLNPYVVGGVNASIPKLRDFTAAIPLGLGINFNFHPQVSLQWQSDFRLALVNGSNHLQHSIGLVYMLGNKKSEMVKEDTLVAAPMDSDKDGIIDNLDLCPSQFGSKEFNGCPDTDKDGVADKDDKCPDTPGSKKLQGCPDSDNDGIADSDDECPNQKGTKEYKGCPPPDADNDGITDADDKCPNEKGTKANKGCPEPKKEEKMEKVAPKDTDGDGIMDEDDKCPNEKGTKANKGCPEPKKEEKMEKVVPKDTDGDGIMDEEDKCPNEKGTKANKGCPEPKKEEKMEKVAPKDTDGDGLIDAEDKCPDEKGTKANNGCPEPKKEEKMEKPAPKDTDGDGIVDDKDLCPDKAGLFEMQGCPDSDGDGVSDKYDECPDKPGSKSKNGCPEQKKDENMEKVIIKDSDGDGINDEKDDCPFAYGSSKFHGCPDTDGDGVSDKIDRCPKEPGPASSFGCPEIEKKDMELLDYAMRAVQFDLSRSTLREESFKVLDKIGAIIKKYPSYNLVISGHTDNTGSEKLNQDLSERRAKVCMDYLISKGIPASRMSYAGFGSKQPIADNKTDTGKFLNRRTEFNLTLPK